MKILLQSLFILFLLAISGCESHNEKKKNLEYVESIKPIYNDWSFNDINSFYTFVKRQNLEIRKVKTDFLFDTCYVCIQYSIPDLAVILFYYENGQINSYAYQENFEAYLEKIKQLYDLSKLNNENIKLFFSLFMMGYHPYYDNIPENEKDQIKYFCELLNFKYLIDESKIVLDFSFVKRSKKMKYLFHLTYLKEAKLFTIEYLNPEPIKFGTPRE
jgi:hypothetical protein